MTFDPSTAYAADYAFTDEVEDGTLVVRDANAEAEASYPVKLLREGRMASSVKYLWLLGEAPPPKYSDALVLADGTELFISETPEEHPTGPYEITCTEPARNE